MDLALGTELTNARYDEEELVASIRTELEATTAMTDNTDTEQGDQVEITMGDGRVLKGQLEEAKVPLDSGYGTIEVETSAITGNAEGQLELEDGSVLKGAYGDGDIALTTSQGALKIPTREIVAMVRSGASEPAEGPPTKTPAPGVAEREAVLDGRVLNRFSQPVSGATVLTRLEPRATTDAAGNY